VPRFIIVAAFIVTKKGKYHYKGFSFSLSLKNLSLLTNFYQFLTYIKGIAAIDVILNATLLYSPIKQIIYNCGEQYFQEISYEMPRPGYEILER
jgi:hypothetical protein